MPLLDRTTIRRFPNSHNLLLELRWMMVTPLAPQTRTELSETRPILRSKVGAGLAWPWTGSLTGPIPDDPITTAHPHVRSGSRSEIRHGTHGSPVPDQERDQKPSRRSKVRQVSSTRGDVFASSSQLLCRCFFGCGRLRTGISDHWADRISRLTQSLARVDRHIHGCVFQSRENPESRAEGPSPIKRCETCMKKRYHHWPGTSHSR